MNQMISSPPSRTTPVSPEAWETIHAQLQQKIVDNDPSVSYAQLRLAALRDCSSLLPNFGLVDALVTELQEGNQTLFERLAASARTEDLMEWSDTLQRLADQVSRRLIGMDRLQCLPEQLLLDPTSSIVSLPAKRYFHRSDISIDVLRKLFPEVREETRESFHKLLLKMRLQGEQAEALLNNWVEHREGILVRSMAFVETLDVSRLSIGVLSEIVVFFTQHLLKSVGPSLENQARLVARAAIGAASLRNFIFRDTANRRKSACTEPKVEPIENLTKLEPLVLSELCIAAERRASEHIRTQLLPTLKDARSSLTTAFWEIHRARFANNPQFIHNFGSTSGSVTDYTRTCSNAAFYKRSVGALRWNGVCDASSFRHLLPDHLPELSEFFFAALEYRIGSAERPIPRPTLLRILTASQAFLTIAHLPFDSSGRTTEDFLTLIALRGGEQFSLSNSGYRHHLSHLVEEFSEVESALKREIEQKIFEDLGLSVGDYDPFLWGYHTSDLANTLVDGGDLAIDVEKARIALQFIRALIDADSDYDLLCTQLPSLKAVEIVLNRGFDHQFYVTEPTEAQKLDTLIARSCLTSPFRLREQLYSENESVPATALGEIFRVCHLEGDKNGFVSVQLEERFERIRRDIEEEVRANIHRDQKPKTAIPFVLDNPSRVGLLGVWTAIFERREERARAKNP